MVEPLTTSAQAVRAATSRPWWRRWLDALARPSRVPGPSLDVLLALHDLPISAERAVRRAFLIGVDRNHQAIGTAHLLLALLIDTEVRRLLGDAVDVRPVVARLGDVLDTQPPQFDDRLYAARELNSLIDALTKLHGHRARLTAANMLAVWLRANKELRAEMNAVGFNELAFLQSISEAIETDVPDEADLAAVILMHNDDFSSREFVVAMLQDKLGLDADAAQATMLSIHFEGTQIVWTGERAAAEELVREITDAASKAREPLRVTVGRKPLQ